MVMKHSQALIMGAYKHNGGWTVGMMCNRMHVPLPPAQIMPHMYGEMPSVEKIENYLTYELKLIDNRYFVVCEGLTVDSWYAGD